MKVLVNKRVYKLSRSLNTLDGRDVIELKWRKYNECDDELYDDDDELNDELK